LEIPDGSVAVGDWKQPAPGVTRSGEFIYTDSVIFERRCRASLNAGTEPLSIAATLRFQACNDEVCRPPATLNLVARVRIAEKSTR
jgi:DsbC/DsbD-like thiol-disulfide interchange protein